MGTTSLRLNATSSGTSLATIRATANAAGSRENLRSSLAGQSIVVDVFPETVGPNAFLEIRVELSDQPLSGGRSAGTYSIAYRIGGPDAPGTRRISGRDGFIGLECALGFVVDRHPDARLRHGDPVAGPDRRRQLDA